MKVERNYNYELMISDNKRPNMNFYTDFNISPEVLYLQCVKCVVQYLSPYKLGMELSERDELNLAPK